MVDVYGVEVTVTVMLRALSMEEALVMEDGITDRILGLGAAAGNSIDHIDCRVSAGSELVQDRVEMIVSSGKDIFYTQHAYEMRQREHKERAMAGMLAGQSTIEYEDGTQYRTFTTEPPETRPLSDAHGVIRVTNQGQIVDLPLELLTKLGHQADSIMDKFFTKLIQTTEYDGVDTHLLSDIAKLHTGEKSEVTTKFRFLDRWGRPTYRAIGSFRWVTDGYILEYVVVPPKQWETFGLDELMLGSVLAK